MKRPFAALLAVAFLAATSCSEKKLTKPLDPPQHGLFVLLSGEHRDAWLVFDGESPGESPFLQNTEASQRSGYLYRSLFNPPPGWPAKQLSVPCSLRSGTWNVGIYHTGSYSPGMGGALWVAGTYRITINGVRGDAVHDGTAYDFIIRSDGTFDP